MATHSLIDTRHSPRRSLRMLDGVLDALEDLNLHEMTSLPTRIGGALQRAGVADPYRLSIPELIDVVFDLQEPLLERLRTSSNRRRQDLRARR